MNRLFAKLFFACMAIVFISACSDDSSTNAPVVPSTPTDFEPLKTVELASQPMYTFYDSKTKQFNVLCLGVDINFNGTKDDGDEAPSWWTIDAASHKATKIMDFEFASMPFPVRATADVDGRTFYITLKTKYHHIISMTTH